MRKVLTLAIALFTVGAAHAQTQIFFEGFSGGMPAAWNQIDNDGRTIDPLWTSQSGYNMTTAWIVDKDLAQTNNDVAISTSWYSPAGTADDWLITDSIWIDSFTKMEWVGKSYGNVLDDYEVRISPASQGDSIASFNANPIVATVVEEDNDGFIRHFAYLNATGITNQWVHLAFVNNTNGGGVGLAIDSIELINPASKDLVGVDLDIPGSNCSLGANEDITITITNQGFECIDSIEVSYTINGGTAVTEYILDTLCLNDTVEYTFATQADFSTNGQSYQVSVSIDATNDANPGDNDLGQTIVNVQESTIPYNTSFEDSAQRLGWQTSAAAGVNGGIWLTINGLASQGTASTGFVSLGVAADDWRFSTCLDLTSGTAYEVSFDYATSNLQTGTAQTPESFEVYIGQVQDAAAMTTNLGNYTGLTNSTFDQGSEQFTVSSNGIYYIGFRATSDASALDLLVIDNFNVEVLAPPVADFTFDTTQLDVDFTDVSTNNPDAWDWDFDDGSNNSAMQNPSHTYTSPGVYNVCLTATNLAGSDTECKDVAVDIDDPNVDFSLTIADLQVTFTNLTQPLSQVDSIVWDFGDGNGSNNVDPIYTYASGGQFTVCLNVYVDGTPFQKCTTVVVSSLIEIPDALINVFPNPANEYLTVELELDNTSAVEISITDILGQQIRKMNLGQTRSENIKIDINDIPSGTYFLNMKVNESSATQKIIITH